MKFELPFTGDTVDRLVGKTIVFSDNHRNESLFKRFSTLNIKGGGDFEKGHLEAEDGVLRVVDQQGLFCHFDGIETRNGAVFAVGTAAHVISRDGFDRITMHEMNLISLLDFGVCITSHVNYSKVTLPILLDSLKKSNFEMDRVVVVVGGYAGEKEETMDGARVIYQQSNFNGFGGLTAVTDDEPYWLHLHDTCEAERSFISTVSRNIDIGLNPDLIRLSDNDDGTGFYRTEFINKFRKDMTAKSEITAGLIRRMARVITTVPGKVVDAGTKDIYGTGNKRRIEKLSVGIRKYRGVKGRRVP